MKRLLPIAAAAAIVLIPNAALAWGNTGHRMIGELAVRDLPTGLPAFVRTAQAAREIGELSREPDRSKGAGRVHDTDRDPAHFFDADDEGRALGGPLLAELPPTRAEYEKALAAAGTDSWKAGYLPYAIVDRYQQLAQDFAYWRVLHTAEANPRWRTNRAWFAADRRRREALILKSIGELSHFVADGSQPLHVSMHYNGWGDYPNPQGYTQAKIHGPFEGELIERGVRTSMIKAAMRPPRAFRGTVEQRTADYLSSAWRRVVPLYELEKAGGLAPGDPRGVDFIVRQMGAGASELRDLIVLAWDESANRKVGWKPVAVADVLSGAIDPYPALYGID